MNSPYNSEGTSECGDGLANRDAIDQISDLKAKYCRYLDTKSWDQFASLFTHDACMQMEKTSESAIIGPTTIVQMLKKEILTAKTVHQVHPAEFEFNIDGSVSAIWPMQDIVENKFYRLNGAGFYREKYVMENGKWFIQHWRLLRTRVDFKPKSIIIRIVLLLNRIGILRLISPKTSLKMSQTLSACIEKGDLP